MTRESKQQITHTHTNTAEKLEIVVPLGWHTIPRRRRRHCVAFYEEIKKGMELLNPTNITKRTTKF